MATVKSWRRVEEGIIDLTVPFINEGAINCQREQSLYQRVNLSLSQGRACYVSIYRNCYEIIFLRHCITVNV